MQKNNSLTILEKQKADLERQIESVRMKIYGLEHQLKAVSIAISTIKGDPIRGNAKKKMTLKKEILAALENHPDGLYVSEIAQKIEEKNNLTVSKPSVSSTLTRLKQDKVVDYYDGIFKLRTKSTTIVRDFSDDDISF